MIRRAPRLAFLSWAVPLVAAVTLLDGHEGHARPKRVLRVCADPAGLPMSNEREEGFENEVAALLARELHAKLEYTWWVERRGFLRNTLQAGRCDVVLGVPAGADRVRATSPWYRSTFAFVSRRSSGLGDLRSIDDPRLRELRIGVPLTGDDGANPTPIHALSRRGIVDNVRGFHVYADLGRDVPAALDALAEDAIDVAILWGPIAGASARRAKTPLVVTPLAEADDDGRPFAFSIAMGVRRSDEALARELDAVLARRQGALAAILTRAGVPLLPLPSEGDLRAR